MLPTGSKAGCMHLTHLFPEMKQEIFLEYRASESDCDYRTTMAVGHKVMFKRVVIAPT